MKPVITDASKAGMRRCRARTKLAVTIHARPGRHQVAPCSNRWHHAAASGTLQHAALDSRANRVGVLPVQLVDHHLEIQPKRKRLAFGRSKKVKFVVHLVNLLQQNNVVLLDVHPSYAGGIHDGIDVNVATAANCRAG